MKPILVVFVLLCVYGCATCPPTVGAGYDVGGGSCFEFDPGTGECEPTPLVGGFVTCNWSDTFQTEVIAVNSVTGSGFGKNPLVEGWAYWSPIAGRPVTTKDVTLKSRDDLEGN
jgi:hypothetical protein